MRRAARKNRGSAALDLPLMPFLSIMLGLMSVMSLITLGVTVKQRETAKSRQAAVELVGIPADFIPFHVRCTATGVEWRDGDAWQTASMLSLITLIQRLEHGTLPAEGERLLAFITARVEANRELSYQRRQNTMIMWVEPDGVDAADYLSWLLSLKGLPLRYGRLPVLKHEVIGYDASTPR